MKINKSQDINSNEKENYDANDNKENNVQYKENNSMRQKKLLVIQQRIKEKTDETEKELGRLLLIKENQAEEDNFLLAETPGQQCSYNSVFRFAKKNIINKSKEDHKKEKIKKKIILPTYHRLITNKNYQHFLKEIALTMENIYLNDMQRLGIDRFDKEFQKRFLEIRFLYIYIGALIHTKLIHHINSEKGGKYINEIMNYLITYFKQKIGLQLQIDKKYLVKKLRNNLKQKDTYPLDLSYEYALLEDIELWENYLDSTYFIPQNTNINELRVQIMKEYNSQKGRIALSFELLNPGYHIYKKEEEKYKKQLNLLLDHQKQTKDANPYLQKSIEDIKQKLAYAREKKEEHATCIESRFQNIIPQHENSLTNIKNKTLKKYNIPFQYWHIFGIVMNKLNNFYQIKASIWKKSEEKNIQLFEHMIHAENQNKYIFYFLNNYITFADMEKAFNKKWQEKWIERKMKMISIIKDEKYLIKTKRSLSSKKNFYNENQLSLDL